MEPTCAHHSCGREALPSKRLCDHHHAYHLAYQREYRHRRKAERDTSLCSVAYCKNQPVEGRKQCQECRDYHNEARDRSRAKTHQDRVDGVLCAASDCKNPPSEGFKTCTSCRERIRIQQLKQNQTPKRIAYVKDRRRQHRAEVYEQYGGAYCQCCGSTEFDFLTMDHVGGDPGKRPGNLYDHLIKEGFPSGFRVLCRNCNWSLGHYGYCVHSDLQQPVRTGRFGQRDQPRNHVDRTEREVWMKTSTSALRNHRMKVAAFRSYGGVRCACCGIDDYEFLALDHIDESGSEHRTDAKVRNSIYEWAFREDYPPGLQVLCHNCNYSKSNHGGCPHTRSESTIIPRGSLPAST